MYCIFVFQEVTALSTTEYEVIEEEQVYFVNQGSVKLLLLKEGLLDGRRI